MMKFLTEKDYLQSIIVIFEVQTRQHRRKTRYRSLGIHIHVYKAQPLISLKMKSRLKYSSILVYNF